VRLTEPACRALFAAARSVVLATVRRDGAPHLVPVTFAQLSGTSEMTAGGIGLDGTDVVVFAVDHKPKSTLALQRLANIAAEPRVALLADHYDDDWSLLWWVRVDAAAEVLTGDAAERALDALAERYPFYREIRPTGPVVGCSITRWTGWAARPGGPAASPAVPADGPTRVVADRPISGLGEAVRGASDHPDDD
jgi:PPOX class probable F420-dependent enzyme